MSETALLASYWTIAGRAFPHTDMEHSPFDFRDRVEAVARVGFKGFGIWHADLARVLERRSLKEMKGILDDNGMEHVELEFLTDWFLDGEGRKKSDALRKVLLRAAETLGARHIKVGDFFRTQCSMPRLTESFRELCAQAADYGTRIVFELMPFANIDTLDKALELVRGADAPNGGLILDLWHVVRLGIPYEEIRERVPLRYLLAVELNDGDLEVKGDLHDATINHRKLCGEGEFDIAGFIDCLERAGYKGPYGIEVLSEELRPLALKDLASRAFNTTIEHFKG